MALTAKDYLANIGIKYSRIQRYSDTGVAFPASGDAHRVTFATEFCRGEYYKLQYTMHSDKPDGAVHHEIYSDFNTVKLDGDWGKFKPVLDKNDPNSLPDILACASGLSLGAAAYIPSLLFLEDWEGFQVTALKTPEFVSSEEPVIISGAHPRRENYQITVTFDDMLVQSIEVPSEKFRIEFKPEESISEPADAMDGSASRRRQ